MELNRRTILEWGLFGVVTAGVGYLLYKRYGGSGHGHGGGKLLKEVPVFSLEKFKQEFYTNMDNFYKLLKDSFLSPQVQEALETIGKIIESLKEMENIKFSTPILLLLPLIYKSGDFKDECFRDFPDIKGCEFEKSKEIGRFAVRIYSASLMASKTLVAKFMGIQLSSLLYVSWVDSKKDNHHPKFLIFETDDSVFLVIRGTYSITDIFLDAVCSEAKFDTYEGYVHHGILEGAVRIIEKSLPILQTSLETGSRKKVIVTGHSLGGGTAEIITMELIKHFENEKKPDTLVECVSLAPPPVFRSSSKLPNKIKNAIKIFINTCDIVPSLSLATMALFISILRKVDDLNLSLEDQFYILMGSQSEETQTNIKKIKDAVVSAKQEKFPFLEHPGKIYYFSKTEDGTNRLFLKNTVSEYFSRQIRLFDGMIANHLHSNYEVAFDKVIVLEN